MLNWQRQALVVSLSCSLVIAGAQAEMMSAAAQTVAAAPPAAIAQPAPRLDAADLDQLVAPIALYPDMLVAEVLAASAHPVEIVEAERWMLQDGAYLHGQALAEAVDQQPWDPSVKALTQFPAVLASMNTNLAWTSALGDAYVTQQPDVLDAVQAMRRRAEAAGNLKSSSEQIVTTTEQTIVIAPAKPQIVYVPQYDPRLVYGAPVAIYPGWTPFPGMYFNEPGILFGAGLGIGLFAGWLGWHHWGADWHDHRLCTTIPPGSRAAESSGFTVATYRDRPCCAAPRGRTACIPARSAASIMAALRAPTPCMDSRASTAGSVAAFTAAAFTAAVFTAAEVTGNAMPPRHATLSPSRSGHLRGRSTTWP